MTKTQHFEDWAKDLSRAELLKDHTFFGNCAVIEIYREPTSEDNSKVDIIVNQKANGTFEFKSQDVSYYIKPVAKVIALGNGIYEDYKSLKIGDIIAIPDGIKNVVDNPEFINLLQMTNSNSEPKLVPGMKKKLLRFATEWNKWLYKVDKLSEMTPEDALTYLIHLNSSTIVGKLPL